MIRWSDVMLAIASRRSVKSPWFEREVYEAMARERDEKCAFVLPLVLDDEAVTNMPHFIRRRQYVDFRNDYEKALADLARSLNAILEGSRDNLMAQGALLASTRLELLGVCSRPWSPFESSFNR
jgi:TIR domain